MLAIPNNAQVFLALTPVDFRKQIPGLKKWIQNELELNPLSSAYFIFLARDKKSLKILHFDGQGTWLHQKKLSQGKFKGWKGLYDVGLKHIPIHSLEAQLIYLNGSARKMDIQANWQAVGF